jgi:hypothetical protein
MRLPRPSMITRLPTRWKHHCNAGRVHGGQPIHPAGFACAYTRGCWADEHTQYTGVVG